MEKDSIIGVLGERPLLLPDWIGGGLAANERAKFLFTLLQTACWCADHPEAPRPDLDADRQACGLHEPWLEAVVGGARPSELGYTVPGASRLIRRMFDETEAMLRPLLAVSDTPSDEVAVLARRLESLRDATAGSGNQVEAAQVAQITAIDPVGTDSLHRLVMDLHKELNQLQASISHTSIGGAATYGLEAGDAALVEAFMAGINATAKLKFDHPGLGTTATRSDGRLILQNDIGTTDAHVLVIHVEGLTVTVTYSDVHLERLNFFRSLSDGFDVAWRRIESRQSEAIADSGLFHLSVGTLVAADQSSLEAYLTHLGSSLVFLIDWNRARKRLRLLVAKIPALALLRWAAENRYGHRAFLILGGDQLVFDTLTYAAKAPLPYGARLDQMLGEAAAVDYLKYLFRTAAEGLLAGRSEALIREQAKAELISRFSSTEELIMAIVAEHAGLIQDSARAVRDLVEGGADADQTARSAKDWESAADHLVIRARALVKRSGGPDVLRRLLEEADDAIDEIEEGAFLLTLQPARGPGTGLFRSQRDLATLVVAASEDWGKAVASAARIRRGGAREDLQCFLEAVDRVVSAERQGDVAERSAKAELLELAEDFRQLHVFIDFAGRLEGASDALMRAALVLREHILSDVIAA